ncbi:unnamed protein product [Protopolystoma xenopodis]|uniref:Uncharacterized protein n=1 Tax=Protopolystoma xenopodis TaxID=117903 RepID=A0A3S5BR98_9PLAT|nr:unnamed protein product [Protopolystoma xenopodis]
MIRDTTTLVFCDVEGFRLRSAFVNVIMLIVSAQLNELSKEKILDRLQRGVIALEATESTFGYTTTFGEPGKISKPGVSNGLAIL